MQARRAPQVDSAEPLPRMARATVSGHKTRADRIRMTTRPVMTPAVVMSLLIGAGALPVVPLTSASAHATIELFGEHAKAGRKGSVTMRIPHGCNGSLATDGVAVTLSRQWRARPQQIEGWEDRSPAKGVVDEWSHGALRRHHCRRRRPWTSPCRSVSPPSQASTRFPRCRPVEPSSPTGPNRIAVEPTGTIPTRPTSRYPRSGSSDLTGRGTDGSGTFTVLSVKVRRLGVGTCAPA